MLDRVAAQHRERARARAPRRDRLRPSARAPADLISVRNLSTEQGFADLEYSVLARAAHALGARIARSICRLRTVIEVEARERARGIDAVGVADRAFGRLLEIALGDRGVSSRAG